MVGRGENAVERETFEGLTFEIIPGPIVLVTWQGEASEAGIRALYDYAARAREAYGEDVATRAIIDAREATGIERAGRAEFRRSSKNKSWEYAAIVGIRFEIRVVLELAAKGIEILKLPLTRLGFFDDQAEAMAWLETKAGERA